MATDQVALQPVKGTVIGFTGLWQPGSLHERGHPAVQRPHERRSEADNPNIYADDDTVIVFFDAGATARDGRPYANTYAWFLDMHDGKAVNAWAFFDGVEFNEF